MSISLPSESSSMNDDLISVTHKANAEAKLLRVMRTTLRFARFASDGGTEEWNDQPRTARGFIRRSGWCIMTVSSIIIIVNIYNVIMLSAIN